MKKRIVLIDNNLEFLEANSLILLGTGHYEVMGQYRFMEDAIHSFRRSIPDVILMDIHLGGELNPIQAIRTIKQQFPPIAILVYTHIVNQDSVFSCLKAGVVGYITKDHTFTQLLDALREIEHGGSPLSSKVSRLIVNNFYENPNSPLSVREKEVLRNLAEGRTYSEIAIELNISAYTSKVHIRNIYSKLNVHNRSAAIALAKKESYL